MKKTYIKPQLWVMATAANELLQTSWRVKPTNNDDEPGKDDYGKIINDKGKKGFEENHEYDPWTESNW